MLVVVQSLISSLKVYKIYQVNAIQYYNFFLVKQVEKPVPTHMGLYWV